MYVLLTVLHFGLTLLFGTAKITKCSPMFDNPAHVSKICPMVQRTSRTSLFNIEGDVFRTLSKPIILNFVGLKSNSRVTQSYPIKKI